MGFIFPAALAAAALVSAPAAAPTQDWLVQTDMFGTPLYQAMTLRADAAGLRGELDGDALSGV